MLTDLTDQRMDRNLDSYISHPAISRYDKNEVFFKMLDSSHTLLFGLFKKVGVRIKKLEFKTQILKLRRTMVKLFSSTVNICRTPKIRNFIRDFGKKFTGIKRNHMTVRCHKMAVDASKTK